MKILEDIYALNANKRFKVVAISTAGVVLTHCWSCGADRMINGILLINPAFEFRSRNFWLLAACLTAYYTTFFAIIVASYFCPWLILLTPFAYVLLRILNIPKAKDGLVKSCISSVKNSYPLIATCLLPLLQFKTRRAIRRNALNPLGRAALIVADDDLLLAYSYALRLFRDELEIPTAVIREGGHSILHTQWDEPSLQRVWNQFFA